MTFADIPAGVRVFLDANVFVYHFVPDPVFGPACRDLLDRIPRNEIAGFTSSAVLSDVAHRVMTIEAAETYGWPMTGIAYRLQHHPAELKTMTRLRQAVEEVPAFGVQVLLVDASHVVTAAALSPTARLAQRRCLGGRSDAGERSGEPGQRRQLFRPRAMARAICAGVKGPSPELFQETVCKLPS